MRRCEHVGPSTIGIDTIYKSKGNIPEVFLRGAGVPEDFIVYMRSLVGKAIDFYSCFISYSSQDDDFAQRLYADLQAKNVRCWKFDENAKWGEPVWGEIDTAIRHYDKLVVICSKHSLQSPPVIREIERALQKEDREHRNVLFPIRIDDYLFDEWDHPRKADVVSKVIGDFRGWKRSRGLRQGLPPFPRRPQPPPASLQDRVGAGLVPAHPVGRATCGRHEWRPTHPARRRRNQNLGPGPGQSAQTFSYAAPRTPNDPPGWLDAKPWTCPVHSNSPDTGFGEVGGTAHPHHSNALRPT